MADKTVIYYDNSGNPFLVNFHDNGDGTYSPTNYGGGAAAANTEGTALASGIRNTTTVSTNINNPNARGVMVFFNVTAVPGGDTVALSVRGIDPVSGNTANLFVDVAQAGAGLRYFQVYPGIVVGAALHGGAAVALPKTFNIQVGHSGVGNFTYSVGYCLIV